MKPMFLNKEDKFVWTGDERITRGEEGWYSQYICEKSGMKVMVNVYFDEEPEHFKDVVVCGEAEARVVKHCAGVTYYKHESKDFAFSKAIDNEEEARSVGMDFFDGKKCEFVFSGMIRVDKG